MNDFARKNRTSTSLCPSRRRSTKKILKWSLLLLSLVNLIFQGFQYQHYGNGDDHETSTSDVFDDLAKGEGEGGISPPIGVDLDDREEERGSASTSPLIQGAAENTNDNVVSSSENDPNITDVAEKVDNPLQEQESEVLEQDVNVTKDEKIDDPLQEQEQEQESGGSEQDMNAKKDESMNVLVDADCPFRNSSIYRSIYVYPSPGDDDWTQALTNSTVSNITISHSILSEFGQKNGENITWPWVEINERTHRDGLAHYQEGSNQWDQYTTELLVRDIITHPQSCLRTHDPESAKLFYVPYLPSVEYHNASLYSNYATSAFGKALIDATAGKYDAWENTFGLTSKYWQRRGGSDHILVYSEPMHGLWHPRSRRGNFHFVRSQFQLRPPIAISVELSTTFVNMYPNCARKNILVPYPNTDGQWFNGQYHNRSLEVYRQSDMGNITSSLAALDAEKRAFDQNKMSGSMESNQNDENPRTLPRPLSQFYSGGNHGSCTGLRKTISHNYKCTNAGKFINEQPKGSQVKDYTNAYHRATFCPCPGGDSPSAKRMFDALHGGCIPLILSEDFVWPYSGEFDRIGSGHSQHLPDPKEFSIRLNANDYMERRYNDQCEDLNATAAVAGVANQTNEEQEEEQKAPLQDLQSFIETVSEEEIQKLRQAAEKASDVYAYYRRREDLPANPLREGILPDGGAAYALVEALSQRADGALWDACDEEIKSLMTEGGKHPEETDGVKQFKC